MALEQPKLTISLEDKVTAELKKVTEQLEKMSASQKKTSAEVFKGVAAWDIMKSTLMAVGNGIKASINASMEAAADMAIVAVNVKNAGYSFDDLSESMNAQAQAAIKLGFDDEEAMMSMSKLFNVTSNTTEAFKLNSLAMDLARNKGIGLETSTQAIILAMNGNVKILKSYGITLDENATKLDIINALQGKVKDSADLYSKTIKGQTEILKVQFGNLQETVGDVATIFLSELYPAISKVMEVITKMVSTFAEFVVVNKEVVGQVLLIVTGLLGFIAVMLNLTKIVKAFGVVQGIVNGIMALNPISLIIIGVTLLVAAFVALTIKMGGVGNAFKTVWLSILIATNAFVGGMKELLNAVVVGPINLLLKGVSDLANAFIFLSNLTKKEGEKMAKVNWEIPAMSTDKQSANIKKYVAEIQSISAANDAKLLANEKSYSDKKKQIVTDRENSNKEVESKATKDAIENLKKIQDAFDDLDKKSGDVLKGIINKMDELTQKKYELSVDFGTAKNEVRASYAEAYVKEQETIQKALEESNKVAEEKADLEKKLAKETTDLNEKLTKAETETDKAEIRKQILELTTSSQTEIAIKEKERLAKQNILNTERAALEANKNLTVQYAGEIAEAQRLAGLTEFERTIEALNQKKAAIEQEYADKQIAITKELELEEAKKNQIISMIDAEMFAFEASLNKKTKLTEESVNAQIEKWKELQDAMGYINEAKTTTSVAATANSFAPSPAATGVPEKIAGPSQIGNYTNITKGANGVDLYGIRIPGRANGGSVNANDAYMVGENGPETFIPRSGGSIAKNGAGMSIILNITGNKIMNERDAEDFGNLIIRKLTKTFNV